MRFTLMITGPAYGTQQAQSALLFARALISEGHQLESVFFYREGVHNANQLTSPANDEVDMVREWQSFQQQGTALHVCVAAALRRGIADSEQANLLDLTVHNLQKGFVLAGLGALAEAALTSDRVMQF